jgi:hypothetical protein
MYNLIKQIDYHDRNNKNKKAWAKAYDKLDQEEIEKLEDKRK